MVQMGIVGIIVAIFGIWLVLSNIKESEHMHGGKKLVEKIRGELRAILITEFGVLSLMILHTVGIIG